jgi:hypothetical protein
MCESVHDDGVACDECTRNAVEYSPMDMVSLVEALSHSLLCP